MEKLNSYDLSRNWFNFCFENPELISPNHSAIYFFAVEHCNRLGWKEKFGFPTQMAMDAIGIKKHQTYIKYFEDICEWGFFKLVQKSKNQYSSNIISLTFALPKKGEALDKAITKHTAKQTQSNGQSNSSILKQETRNKETIKESVFSFDDFWNQYDKKVDSKKCKDKYDKISEIDKQKIKDSLQTYLDTITDKKYQKNPLTFLNGQCWNDYDNVESQPNKIEQDLMCFESNKGVFIDFGKINIR